MINLRELDSQEFEILVGLLLKSVGHIIVRGPENLFARGPDYETISPNGDPVVVEVKHFKHGVSKSHISQFSGDLERYRKQKTDIKGLLVLSSKITQVILQDLEKSTGIEIWDATTIQSLLIEHPKISHIFKSLQISKKSFESQVTSLMGSPQSPSEEFSIKLHNLPCGKGHWRDYERLCTEILTYVLTPSLGPPDIQSRSDDGLDIIDAIFPIRSENPPWSIVRSEFRTRFTVAEFKNYCEPIDQRQVESIAQYLWNKAHRNFGLLVSRRAPSESALAQRRRQWLENEKMIVLLDDEDLCEMLQLKESKGQPYDVIDTQLEEFLRTLTP